MIGKYSIDVTKCKVDEKGRTIIVDSPGLGKAIKLHEDWSYDIVDVVKREPQNKEDIKKLCRDAFKLGNTLGQNELAYKFNFDTWFENNYINNYE